MEGHFFSFGNNFLQLVTFSAQKYDRRFFHIKTKKGPTEIPTTNAKNYAVLRPEHNGRHFADRIFINCVFPEWNQLYFLIQKEKIVTLTRQNATVKLMWVSCNHTRTLLIVQKRRDLIEIEYIAVECEPSVIRELFLYCSIRMTEGVRLSNTLAHINGFIELYPYWVYLTPSRKRIDDLHRQLIEWNPPTSATVLPRSW